MDWSKTFSHESLPLPLNDMKTIVDFIDQTITNHENENLITKIKSEVNEFMSDLPLFRP